MKIKFSMEAECCLPIIKKTDQEGKKNDDSFLASLGPFASENKSSIWEKIGFTVTVILETFYECIYFHFFPYLAIFFNTFK